MSSQKKIATVLETVISCVEASRLIVTIKRFIKFKRLRDLCEKQLLEKARRLKEEFVPISLRALIDNNDFSESIADWINATLLIEITGGRLSNVSMSDASVRHQENNYV